MLKLCGEEHGMSRKDRTKVSLKCHSVMQNNITKKYYVYISPNFSWLNCMVTRNKAKQQKGLVNETVHCPSLLVISSFIYKHFSGRYFFSTSGKYTKPINS